MRINLKSSSAIAPLPVLVIGSYDKEGRANVMTAAWGGVFNDNQVIVTLAKDHLTTKNILEVKEFTLFYSDMAHVNEVDYFGLKSGRDVDKLSKVGFHVSKAQNVNAPIIEEFPIAVECRVNNIISPDNETVVVIADVANISAKEEACEGGRPSLDKMQLIAYDTFNHTYRLIDKVVAKAYTCGNKYL